MGGTWWLGYSTNRYGGEMGGIGFKKTLLCHGTEVMLVWIQVNLRDVCTFTAAPVSNLSTYKQKENLKLRTKSMMTWSHRPIPQTGPVTPLSNFSPSRDVVRSLHARHPPWKLSQKQPKSCGADAICGVYPIKMRCPKPSPLWYSLCDCCAGFRLFEGGYSGGCWVDWVFAIPCWYRNER